MFLYRVKMLYNWYDDLCKAVESLSRVEVEYKRRYTDGSTTCLVVFYSPLTEDELNEKLRTKLYNFQGWLEIIPGGGE